MSFVFSFPMFFLTFFPVPPAVIFHLFPLVPVFVFQLFLPLMVGPEVTPAVVIPVGTIDTILLVTV